MFELSPHAPESAYLYSVHRAPLARILRCEFPCLRGGQRTVEQSPLDCLIHGDEARELLARLERVSAPDGDHCPDTAAHRGWHDALDGRPGLLNSLLWNEAHDCRRRRRIFFTQRPDRWLDQREGRLVAPRAVERDLYCSWLLAAESGDPFTALGDEGPAGRVPGEAGALVRERSLGWLADRRSALTTAVAKGKADPVLLADIMNRHVVVAELHDHQVAVAIQECTARLHDVSLWRWAGLWALRARAATLPHQRGLRAGELTPADWRMVAAVAQRLREERPAHTPSVNAASLVLGAAAGVRRSPRFAELREDPAVLGDLISQVGSLLEVS